MKHVLMKAQELAEAILESETYQEMHRLERALAKDGDAQQAMAAVKRCRHEVEEILSQNELDQQALQRASDALQQAETRMGEMPMIREASEASAAFTAMMENVNQILRLVLTGETAGGSASPGRGCAGGCGGCSGCGHG